MSLNREKLGQIIWAEERFSAKKQNKNVMFSKTTNIRRGKSEHLLQLNCKKKPTILQYEN